MYLPLVMKDFQGPPPFTDSYYVQDISTIAAEATQLAQQHMAAATPQDSVVILDFGQAWSGTGNYGVNLVNRGYISFAVVNSALQSFAYTWLNATSGSSHTLRIVVGINNFGSSYYFNATHAAQFAAWIVPMRTPFIGTRVTVVAGIDAETEYNSVALTKTYIEAFRDNLSPSNCTPGVGENKCLYDFGNAGGCSLTGGNGCNNSWTYDDVWYKSTGLKRINDTYRFAAALPEIYNTVGSHGRQWKNASLRGIALANQPVYFVGVLTQREACRQVSDYAGQDRCIGTDNTPQQGFANLRDSLNSDPLTSQVPIRWLTDISYQIYP